ncbi:glycosyltransferase [Paracoccus jiaweipingae]|uniref:glycosyltransferase n=1 Tax=unclassified Paracoccus (in: a-proteobacteria) TaxID=2688777 RepID=UPI00379BC49C
MRALQTADSQPAERPANWPATPALHSISADNAHLHRSSATDLTQRDQRVLGQILLDQGAVDPRNLMRAVLLRRHEAALLGEILLANNWVSEADLSRALSRQWRTTEVDLQATPPDPRLIDAAGPDLCLARGVVPWRRVGGVTYVATSRPDTFAATRPLLPASFGQVRMLLCTETQQRQAVLATRRIALIRQAETRVPPGLSCRTSNPGRSSRIAAAIAATLALGLWLAPAFLVAALALWAGVTLLGQTVLKLLAFHKTRQAQCQTPPDPHPPLDTVTLPRISVMVPLFAESDVAGKLVRRLSGLTYPRELTDILLVVEETDQMTREALRGATLPRWMRVVIVPDGPVKTKPRALNYALNFCRGDIIGIWDAEDRPEPDQLHKVAHRFAHAPADVACLQGALDFYNPRTNWLARCFTAEYASWFRANLPGVARLGLVVPLGGTTLFFRRPMIEAAGGWDAWNVTEDADLGVRLARMGWRTEILDTTTHEEANCRALPWVKQRSRWIKGYAMTWGVHMRNPAQLWRELGAKRFIAFQFQFLGTLTQYLLAPLMWSFWLILLGLPHPLDPFLATSGGQIALKLLTVLFVTSELVNLAVGLWATRGPAHRHLWPWVPTLHIYHPLGCLAGWKAIYEVVTKPFYWDKTAHGLFDACEEQPPTADHPGVTPVPLHGAVANPAGLGPDDTPGLSLPVLGQVG